MAVYKHKDITHYVRVNYENDGIWLLNFTNQGTSSNEHIGNNQVNSHVELRCWVILDPAYGLSVGENWIPASYFRIIVVHHKTLGGTGEVPAYDLDEILEDPTDITSMWNWSTMENFDVLCDRTITLDPYMLYINELFEVTASWNKTTDSHHFCTKLQNFPSVYASGGTGAMQSGSITLFCMSTLNPELGLEYYRSHYLAFQSRVIFTTS